MFRRAERHENFLGLKARELLVSTENFMNLKRFTVAGGILLSLVACTTKSRKPMVSQVRTYMQYTYPIDPVRIFSIADMDLSYALASTLVEWDVNKQLSSALAKSWSYKGEHTIEFSLRPDLKWSNGTEITSVQVKASFERAFKAYPDDLRGVIKQVANIRCPNKSTLAFDLNVVAKDSNLLGKLTEPQYGILFIKANGDFDTGITTGPYFSSSLGKDELTLKRNPHWFAFTDGVVEEVVIRKPTASYDHQTVLIEDKWPNLALTFSTLPSELMDRYEKGAFRLWSRPLDKVFLISASKSLAKNQLLGLIEYLDFNLDRKKVTAGIGGLKLAKQVVPEGYHLYDPKYDPRLDRKVSIPGEFKSRPLHVLCPGVSPDHIRVKNMKIALTEAIGIEPRFEFVSLDETGARRVKGDYDIYLGGMGLADPDSEGFMSYYFEGDAAVVPAGEARFVDRLDKARKIGNAEERLQELRRILGDAKNGGYILPLFHFSSIGLARAELDLSNIPKTDESLTLSRIRMSGQ